MSNPDAQLELRVRKKEDADLDMTPMIDITFLLLAFFVVVSKMDRQTPIDQPKAVNGAMIPPKKAIVIAATLAADGEANIFMGDTTDEGKMVSGDLKEQEEQLKKYIESEASARPDVLGVLLKADGKVKQKYIAMVNRATTQADIERPLYVGTEQE